MVVCELLIAVASFVAEHRLQARGLQQLWHVGFSSCGSWALDRRLSSCDTQAWLLHGMWDLPGSGLQPVSPALAGGFLTTAPPGKTLKQLLFNANLFFFFFCFVFLFINLFIYLFLAALGLVAARGLSLVAESGGYSSLRCEGFSLRWLLLLRSTGSRHKGFSSSGTWAQLLRRMWDIPRPGLEPVSPALAGGFLTTATPGKSPKHLFLMQQLPGRAVFSQSHCFIIY